MGLQSFRDIGHQKNPLPFQKGRGQGEGSQNSLTMNFLKECRNTHDIFLLLEEFDTWNHLLRTLSSNYIDQKHGLQSSMDIGH